MATEFLWRVRARENETTVLADVDAAITAPWPAAVRACG